MRSTEIEDTLSPAPLSDGVGEGEGCAALDG